MAATPRIGFVAGAALMLTAMFFDALQIFFVFILGFVPLAGPVFATVGSLVATVVAYTGIGLAIALGVRDVPFKALIGFFASAPIECIPGVDAIPALTPSMAWFIASVNAQAPAPAVVAPTQSAAPRPAPVLVQPPPEDAPMEEVVAAAPERAPRQSARMLGRSVEGMGRREAGYAGTNPGALAEYRDELDVREAA